MRQAEAVAASMKNEPPAMATLEPRRPRMSEPPLRAAIIPVTPLQQNCTLLWCTATMRGAFVDPGGDLPRLKAAAEQAGVTIEKILLTHGHIDHCGCAGILRRGARRSDRRPARGRLVLDRPARHEDGRKYGIAGRPFEPSRWLGDGDQVTVGELTFDVAPLPRPHARPRRLPSPANRSSRWSATCCSRARSAAGISRAATSSS